MSALCEQALTKLSKIVHLNLISPRTFSVFRTRWWWVALCLWACDSGGGASPGPAFLLDGTIRDGAVAPTDATPRPPDGQVPLRDASEEALADHGVGGDATAPDAAGLDAHLNPPADAGRFDAGLPAPDAAEDAQSDDAAPRDAAVEPPPGNCHAGPDPLPALALRRQGRFLVADAVRSVHVVPRGLTIYLPAAYDAEPNREWPVLYVHDGQNLFDPRDAAFGVAWELDEAVDALVADGVIEPLIVIGVHNTAGRISEYTPSRDPGRGEGGGAADYGRFLVEELKPALDHRLHTRCGRADTGLMGSSLGGLVSFWLLREYPHVFGKVAAVSPSFWWNEGEALGWVPAVARTFPATSRVWIDGGGGEGNDVDRDGRSSVVADCRAVVEGLAAGGLRFPEQLGYLEIPGAPHNEAAWAERTPAILAWLFGPDPGVPADLRIEVHSEPLQGVPVPVSVHATWPHTALTLTHATPMWVGPVVAGELTAAAGADRLLARWRGREAAFRVDAPVAAHVQLEVTVPANTQGPVYITGDRAQIGTWDPEGRALALVGGRYTATLAMPAGVPFEYKITRGSWDTVEKGPNGEELDNRQGVAQDGPLRVNVARWADSP